MSLRKRVTKKGTVLYFLDYRLGGQRVRESLGPVSQKVAESIWARKKVELDRAVAYGEGVAKNVAARNLTLGDLLEMEYNRLDIAEATRQQKIEKGANLIKHFGEDFPVMSLTPQHIDAYKAARIAENGKPRSGGKGVKSVKPRTVNMELLLVLRTAINRAVDAEILPHSPCKIKGMTETRRRKRALTFEEVRSLVGALAHKDKTKVDRHKTARHMLIVMVNTGLRLGEAGRLKWGDVDLEHRTLRVTSQKRGASDHLQEAVLPLNEEVVQALKERKRKTSKKNDCIFPDHKSNLRRALQAAATRAGIANPEEISPHTLRHTFVTLLQESGASMKEAQELARHRDVRTTLGIYTATREGAKRAAVERLAIQREGPQMGTQGTSGSSKD